VDPPVRMQVRRSLDECGDDHEAEAKPRHGQRVDSKQFGPGHQRPEYLKEITRMERVPDNYRKTRAQARVFSLSSVWSEGVRFAPPARIAPRRPTTTTISFFTTTTPTLIPGTPNTRLPWFP